MGRLRRLMRAFRRPLRTRRASGQPRVGTPSVADKIHFASAIVHTSAVLDQRRLTAVDQDSLRIAIAVGISPNAALLTEDDLARWTGLPNSLLKSYLNALRMVTPLLTKETISIAKAAREQYARALAAAVAHANGGVPDPLSAGAGDPGYDPAGGVGSFDPSPSLADPAGGIPDPAGMPTGGVSPDVSGLGGLTLEGLVSGSLISAVWVAILDWEDLRGGEIEIGHWIGQRLFNSAQNQVAAAIGSTFGAILGGPLGAAVLGFAAVALATGARAAYRNWQGSEDNLVYQAERATCDAAFGDLCSQHDDRILHLRALYQADCERACAWEPKEEDYADIEWATTAIFEATRNAVLVLPRRRQFPGNLTARQRRLLRRQLRARRKQWLVSLDAAMVQIAGGKFLDALNLALTINQAILNQFSELIIVDWAQISTRLSAAGAAWEQDRKSWLARSMQGTQLHLAAYQSASDAQYRSFLTEKDKLTRRRLDALLVLVNKFRRRTSRRPLRSTSELLEYLRAGRINPAKR
jgi:hypothetical protein